VSAPATGRAAVRRAIAHAGARLPPRWRGFAAACTVYGLSLLVQAVLHRLSRRRRWWRACSRRAPRPRGSPWRRRWASSRCASSRWRSPPRSSRGGPPRC
jgi:hypothetical protein